MGRAATFAVATAAFVVAEGSSSARGLFALSRRGLGICGITGGGNGSRLRGGISPQARRLSSLSREISSSRFQHPSSFPALPTSNTRGRRLLLPSLHTRKMSSLARKQNAEENTSSSDRIRDAEATPRFSHWDVSGQVFLRTPDVIGIVNLKPIVPCHVLLIPPSPSIKRFSSLPAQSLGPFFRAVQHVAFTLEKHIGSTASTIAIQDGEDAGQTVDHLHVHILPRRKGDFVPSDAVYEELEGWGWGNGGSEASERAVGAAGMVVPDAEEDRRVRTAEEMKKEAEWLSKLFEGFDPRSTL